MKLSDEDFAKLSHFQTQLHDQVLRGDRTLDEVEQFLRPGVRSEIPQSFSVAIDSCVDHGCSDPHCR